MALFFVHFRHSRAHSGGTDPAVPCPADRPRIPGRAAYMLIHRRIDTHAEGLTALLDLAPSPTCTRTRLAQFPFMTRGCTRRTGRRPVRGERIVALQPGSRQVFSAVFDRLVISGANPWLRHCFGDFLVIPAARARPPPLRRRHDIPACLFFCRRGSLSPFLTMRSARCPRPATACISLRSGTFAPTHPDDE